MPQRYSIKNRLSPSTADCANVRGVDLLIRDSLSMLGPGSNRPWLPAFVPPVFPLLFPSFPCPSPPSRPSFFAPSPFLPSPLSLPSPFSSSFLLLFFLHSILFVSTVRSIPDLALDRKVRKTRKANLKIRNMYECPFRSSLSIWFAPSSSSSSSALIL